MLIDGRLRSVVTLPGYRSGMAPANKGKRYPAEILSAEEIYALMAATSRTGSAGIRDRALIAVLWRGGLRIAEALALYPKDIERALGAIVVLHGKKDQRRTIGIDPQTLDTLECWLARRRELGVGHGRRLFCTITTPAGKPLQSSCVRETLKLLARKAGLEKRVHPHGLRHTHAAELAMEGVPAHLIRRQLGHASLDTTVRYIDHLTPLDVIEAMRARSWPDAQPSASMGRPSTSAASSPGVIVKRTGWLTPAR